MMNKLRISGTQDFMGKKINIIEGGFGANQRVLTDKMVAEIHNIEPKHVRERINNNIKRFKENIDIVDLKQRVGQTDTLDLTSFGYAKQSITQAEHIYLLSERGYAKLIKIMDTDLAWEVHDKLIDEYFVMKEIILSDEQLKATLLLSIYNGGKDGVLASKKLTEIEVKEATAPLISAIEEQRPAVEFTEHVTSSSDTVDIGELSKIIKNEKIDIGRNRLFEYLRKNKILMSNNIPYQTYMTRQWFDVIETTKQTAYGSKVFSKVLVTGKGQIGIVEMLRKDFCNR